MCFLCFHTDKGPESSVIACKSAFFLPKSVVNNFFCLLFCVPIRNLLKCRFFCLFLWDVERGRDNNSATKWLIPSCYLSVLYIYVLVLINPLLSITSFVDLIWAPLGYLHKF